jgi:tetratricopeptide (TPR) repeat protein
LWEAPDSTVDRLQELGDLTTLQDEVVVTHYRWPSLDPEAVLSIIEMLESEVEPGTTNWKEIVSIRALILASLGRLAEARPLFDTLWTLGGPRESIAYMGLMPVNAGLADPSYAPGPVEHLLVLPTDPEARQIALHRAMLYELTLGRAAEARRLGEEALAADSAPRFDFLPSLIEAGFGWADIIEGDTVGGLQRLRSALDEAGYAHGPVLHWSQQLRVALTAALTAYPQTRQEGIRRLRYAHPIDDIVFYGPQYLALGQALEAEGDVAGAVEAYSHFIRLWDRADPGLQPRVETARRALERLGGEARG